MASKEYEAVLKVLLEAVQSVNGGDTVADLDDRAGFVAARAVVILFNLLAENR